MSITVMALCRLERTVQRTLQKLRKRDLVIFEDGLYRIAVPIFSQWIECNAWSTSQLEPFSRRAERMR
jgi:hypothetical protein